VGPLAIVLPITLSQMISFVSVIVSFKHFIYEYNVALQTYLKPMTELFREFCKS